MSDYIHYELPSDRHFVAVCDSVILETPDEDLDRVVQRGIYAFTNKKRAERFTNVVNRATSEPTAHFFTKCHNNQKETNT